LRGAVWIDTLLRVECRARAGTTVDAAYVLADLDGVIDGKLNLSENRQFLAFAFIEGQKALVLRGTWRGLLGSQEKSAIWIHDLGGGKSRRLAKNLNLGTSVVYAEF
jgi:hypothetical protein